MTTETKSRWVLMPEELIRRCVTAMRDAIHYADTGHGRPPNQTCASEIEELDAALNSDQPKPAELTPERVRELAESCLHTGRASSHLFMFNDPALQEFARLIQAEQPVNQKLLVLLGRLEQHHYNPFEPDNQSRMYKEIVEAIASAEGKS